MKNTVLLTGATGCIGSHAWRALQQAGFAVVGVDSWRWQSMNPNGFEA